VGLDLYAKMEGMIPFDEELTHLHEQFLEKLSPFKGGKILDLGCGNGGFMQRAREAGFEIEGIDLSAEMIRMATQKGLSVQCIDIADLEGEYDAVVAIFDVLNYLSPAQLPNFLCEVQKRLTPEGKFFADMNTEYGFDVVAQGAIVLEEGERYGSIDAWFDGEVLTSKLRLFEPKGECFTCHKDEIVQYYHPYHALKSTSPFRHIDYEEIGLYGDEADKLLCTFWD